MSVLDRVKDFFVLLLHHLVEFSQPASKQALHYLATFFLPFLLLSHFDEGFVLGRDYGGASCPSRTFLTTLLFFTQNPKREKAGTKASNHKRIGRVFLGRAISPGQK
jgi:hypothetical protein